MLLSKYFMFRKAGYYFVHNLLYLFCLFFFSSWESSVACQHAGSLVQIRGKIWRRTMSNHSRCGKVGEGWRLSFCQFLFYGRMEYSPQKYSWRELKINIQGTTNSLINIWIRFFCIQARPLSRPCLEVQYLSPSTNMKKNLENLFPSCIFGCAGPRTSQAVFPWRGVWEQWARTIKPFRYCHDSLFRSERKRWLLKNIMLPS